MTTCLVEFDKLSQVAFRKQGADLQDLRKSARAGRFLRFNSIFSLALADKTLWKLIIAGVNLHGKMFEPEYQADIDCHQCLRRQVYFDREIGFYCMSCGHEFAPEEALMLIQKTTLTSQLTHTSGKGEGKPLRLPIIERRLPISKSKIPNQKHVPSEVERSETPS